MQAEVDLNLDSPAYQPSTLPLSQTCSLNLSFVQFVDLINSQCFTDWKLSPIRLCPWQHVICDLSTMCHMFVTPHNETHVCDPSTESLSQEHYLEELIWSTSRFQTTIKTCLKMILKKERAVASCQLICLTECWPRCWCKTICSRYITEHQNRYITCLTSDPSLFCQTDQLGIITLQCLQKWTHCISRLPGITFCNISSHSSRTV